MAELITPNDFTGVNQIQVDAYTQAKLQEYIDTYSREAVYYLLGKDLADLFLADFDLNLGVPTGVYDSIWQPFYHSHNNTLVHSRGMKYYVLSTVWFYYSRDNNISVLIAGNKNTKGQNSTPSADNFFLAKEYNKGIETGRAIQCYILDNNEDYGSVYLPGLQYNIGL